MNISEDRLKQLAKQDKSKIDYSDIPELDSSFWKSAKLVRSKGKKPVTLRIDEDILAYYKSLGKGYQTFMNDVLRSYVLSQTQDN